MFKKKIVMLIAAALMTLSASSAFAAFGDLELIRVYYDRAGAEIATDLGKVKDLTVAGTTTNIAGSFGSLTTGFATYFALDRATNQLWASGSTATPSVVVGSGTGLTSMKNGTAYFYTLTNTQGGTNYTGLASATSSYRSKLSATGQQGSLGNAINTTTRANTEASLASLIGATSGSVTQNLYFWNNGNATLAADKIGTNTKDFTTGLLNANGTTITTNFDGSTTIATTATPIPPAFFLMGSGLLGMFGLRRKTKVA